MGHKELWIKIIEKMSEDLPHAQIITWFKDTAILENMNGVLKVGLPLPFFLGWHQTHYAKKTLEAARSVDPAIIDIEYIVDIALTDGSPLVIDLIKHFPKNDARKLPNRNETRSKDGVVSKILNPAYTLDNFITSAENRLAHAACQNVAKYPGQNYNPLFIYGGVGLGKTHLLQATGAEMIRNDPGKHVMYTSTENFVNEVVQGIRSKNMEYIRKKYRRIDTLIIDDIQFIANKEKSEEEFFHTFNALFEEGKQLIISSDRPPQELTLLSDRLTSRFESGMIIDVKMPDYETRLAILQNKCKDAQIFINQDVLEFIAFNINHSVRALEGVLKQAIANYELEHTAPTVKSVAAMLKTTQKKEIKMVGFLPNDDRPKGAVTMDLLIDSVADYFTVPKSEVMGQSRVRDYTLPRQVIMYLAYAKLRMSLSKIGRALGNRDHTTVMHSIGKMKEQIKNDRQLLRDVNAITREVGIH
ncbi:chromosomal replication initiator protein DnaA [Patescibacteria group bacterium]|nr:chromosomal replication initiator protein DnaA [Patescibacteria group bacterium]MBU1016352.1 chromosomal replication initiator protein DnaA [Patescibacteria group bacterium]MBU1684646.1 chromosomal replication initiator protein DnaA [Patescibacteria group bacterium]MBU1938422.1 chromosomal replication initiator protein DnaA [Patescibacteria group bacterium]